MNVLRCTIIERAGGISFIAPVEALPALLRACQKNPDTAEAILALAERYYHGLRERVHNGLAIFDERNTPGHYEAISEAFAFCEPHEQPPFRVVNDETREASLQPVKAGAILFNLASKRIVQIQNSYGEITRTGRGRFYDGHALTRRIFDYALPDDWAIVP